jgi:hybrid cluster-associated redox disulfide protein
MITEDMKIQDIVVRFPETIPVFQRYGLGCYTCVAGEFENLKSGAILHGVRMEELLRDLRAVARPKS